MKAINETNHQGNVAVENTDSKESKVSRRNFLSMMAAGAGSMALAACGGIGEGDGESAALNGVAKAATSGSADGTTIPPAASITDSAGAVWTVVSGVVKKNGASAGYTSQVQMLLYKGGKVYQQNVTGNFWYWSGTAWVATTDPRTTTSVAAPLFYGVNGHMAWGSGIYQTLSAAAQLAILKDLGASVYRADTADAGMSQTIANALNGAFKNSGVTIMPVINPRSAGWNQSGTEAAAYTLGYNLAVKCTTPLKGLVTHIECGNELDTVGLKIGGDGSASTDWNPAYWPAFRGVIRGMIDGVKAVDPSIKCGVNVGIPMAYRALQMLWSGITPNGTANGVGGAANVRWDFTTYHWYKSSYNIQKAGPKASVDVLQILKDSFGVPIWLTEFGWSGTKDSAQSAADYVTTAMTQYKSVKDKYNVECIMLYAVIDASYGLMQMDGKTKNPAYSAYKNFVAANPV
ncbi:glycosyl hydrolase [Caballeronia humi]|uniref:Glycosyl hydrolase catalytic core n=1 Tax=Caballeronia humi TaxID=326474 RepID=A0A158G4N9_9BURK|nr:glycosyl hydrolase [Caballeronia humi]SAL27026.1 Glycosyl hydrolase catalytic core [Caballeronia humi]